MKKKDNEFCMATEELLKKFSAQKNLFNRNFACLVSVFLVMIFMISIVGVVKKSQITRMSDDEITLTPSTIAATTAKKDFISIPSGTVKANPFLPYRDIGGSDKYLDIVDDVPRYDLIEPPEVIGANSDAARVMDTIVSGILFDKHSPSAILNIEGNDYLVKNGDVINNYKVIAINQDSVTVKLGNNTYKAGIGEILTEGEMTQNEVSNLSKKFGGENR